MKSVNFVASPTTKPERTENLSFYQKLTLPAGVNFLHFHLSQDIYTVCTESLLNSTSCIIHTTCTHVLSGYVRTCVCERTICTVYTYVCAFIHAYCNHKFRNATTDYTVPTNTHTRHVDLPVLWEVRAEALNPTRSGGPRDESLVLRLLLSETSAFR